MQSHLKQLLSHNACDYSVSSTKSLFGYGLWGHYLCLHACAHQKYSYKRNKLLTKTFFLILHFSVLLYVNLFVLFAAVTGTNAY